MKKIISLLVVLAMLMAMVPAVFAADETLTASLVASELGVENGVAVEDVKDGAITFAFADGGNEYGNCPKYYNSGSAIRFYYLNSFTVSADEGYEIVSVTIEAAGNYISADNAAVTNATYDELGKSPIVLTPVDGTAPVVVEYTKTSGNFRIASVTVEYKENAPAVVEPDGSFENPYIVEQLPATLSGSAVAYQSKDVFYLYTAEKDGSLTLSENSVNAHVTVVEYAEGVTMDDDAFWDAMYGDLANGDMTVEVAAGNTYWLWLFNDATEEAADFSATVNYAEESSDEGDDPVSSELILGENLISLDYGVTLSGEYTYTATESGTLTLTVTGLKGGSAMSGMDDWTVTTFDDGGLTLYINEEPLSTYTGTVEVNAGDVVSVIVASNYNSRYGYGFEVTLDVAFEAAAGGETGGDALENGGALSVGDNNVTLNMAWMPAMAANWTFTATEGGYVTVTVTSIDGNTDLAMAFGRGMYTLLVGPDYLSEWSNTMTVYVNAGETIPVVLMDSMSSSDGTPAVINVTFEAGEYVAPEPDGSYDYPYVIETLPWQTELTADMDLYMGVYYTYTAEQDGTIIVTRPADGAVWFDGANWDLDENGNYIFTVTAGDVIVINPYDAAGVFTADWYTGSDDEGGEGDSSNALVLGDNYLNHIDTYTYTAEQSGTLYFTVNTVYCQGAPAAMSYLGEWVNLYVNGETLENIYYGAIEVNAGDVITVQLIPEDQDSYGVDLNLNYEGFTLPEPGTEDNPYYLEFTDCPTVSVEIPAGGSVWYELSVDFYDAVLFVKGEHAAVSYSAYNWELWMPETHVIEADGGVVTYQVVSTLIQIINNGTEPAVFELDAYIPLGSSNNPDTIDDGEDTIELDSDNEGYWYEWIADADGTLTVHVSGTPGWMFYVNNMGDPDDWADDAYGDWNYSDYDPLVDTVTITVKAGDNISVFVSTYDPENPFGSPAGTLTVDFEFVAGTEGGEEGGDEGGDEGDEPTGETLNSASDDASIVIDLAPETNGTLTVDISGNPGYELGVYEVTTVLAQIYDEATDSFIYQEVEELVIQGLLKQTSVPGVYTYELEGGKIYQIIIKCYSTSDWGYADGTVEYSYTFTPSEGGEVEKEETLQSDTALIVGENNVTLLENAITTLFEFYPDATGIYEIKILTENGVMSLWLSSTWSKIEDAVDGVLSVECTSVGQSWLVGVSGVESATIVITKTGDADVEVEIPLVEYENSAELNQFEIPEGATVGEYVDVYGETHTAVLGEDGYYHLDSADGPILLVDMNYLATLSDALNEGRGVMYAYTTDEAGNPVKYDIAAAVRAYEAVCDENGYYPLTDDLLFFYQVYAVGNGVPQFVLEEGYNEESAWMFACLTMTLAEEDVGGDGEDENPKDSDNSMISVAIAAALVSAMSIVALPVVKKHF